MKIRDTPSNLRILFSVCFVLALHIAILFIFHTKNNFLEKTVLVPDYLQYVAIVPAPPTKPARSFSPVPRSKEVVNADLSTSVSPAESISITPDERPKLDLDALRAAAVQEKLKHVRSLVENSKKKNVGIKV